MLTYALKTKKVPLYEEVYQDIKADIIKGVLKPHDKLPSKRAFARNNGISTITIENAYEKLISEGYVYAVSKKGYYVSAFFLNNDVLNVPTKKVFIKRPKEAIYDLDLTANKVDIACFPFSIWAKLLREVMSLKKQELMMISPTGGTLELRQAIANHLKSFRMMNVDADQIIIGAGTEYLYGLLTELLGPQKVYCIENPGYKKLAAIYKSRGITCHDALIDEAGMTVSGLNAASADVAHICPNHHFPTGIRMPIARRYEILAWANQRANRYIIEDDYDSEFRLRGKPLATLYSMDKDGKVIYMNTFAKSLAPTIRVSYMVLPPHLANKFYQEMAFYSCTVSNFLQYPLAEFISEGYFEKHINRMRLYYSKKRQMVMEMLAKSPLKDKCQIIENDAGLHFLLYLKTTVSDHDIVSELQKNKIKICPLSAYFLTAQANLEHYFIINYSSLDLSRLETVFDLIYQIIK